MSIASATSGPIVIDAANLTTGGAVTVAASFLDELGKLLRDPTELPSWVQRLRVEASPEVVANLAPGTAEGLPLEVLRRSPRDVRHWLRKPKPADLIFTVYGPRYGRLGLGPLVMGFADGLSLYPPPAELPVVQLRQRLWHAVRSRISRARFRRADHIVAETAAIADRLHRSWGIPRSRLSVVPGTFNSLIGPEVGSGSFPTVQVPREAGAHHFVYVARAHPHKNHEFLAALGVQLGNRGVTARFVVTLTDAEWAQRSQEFRNYAVNVGPVTAVQLKDLYVQCDTGIFPSLLESFSATPFEVMQMRLPLFASDRDFVRSSCLDAPIYFDPEDAHATADLIASALAEPERLHRHVRRGVKIVAAHPGSRERALSYIRVMAQMVGRDESDLKREADPGSTTACN